MVTIQKWFGTVDDFVDPLIEMLYPREGLTVKDTYKQLNGRRIGWLNSSYGENNIKKFIEIADAIGFDQLIGIIVEKNIKTLGRFENLLNNLI